MGKRSVEWLGNAATNSSVGFGDPGSVEIVSTADFEDKTNPTIVRLEGCLNFQLDRTLDNPPTSSQVICYHVGILVHHESISATALNPLTQQDLDWLWTCCGRIVHPVRNNAGTLQDDHIGLTQFHHIDSRAMRKVRHAHKLSMIVKATSIAGGDSLEFTWNLRVLVKD